MNKTISRALVSVSDKSGIVAFCRRLTELGIDIVSTGGTAKTLTENGIGVTDVSALTGFPEMMDGRVKTLHPKIHGGILGRRGVDEEIMAAHGILPFDLVVVNLYPFERTIRREGCDLATAIENIDIGGPAMIRGSAKNYQDVAVVVDPSGYDAVLAELEGSQNRLCLKTRRALALAAFNHTARYDSTIATYLSQREGEAFPEVLNLQFQRQEILRYGENPHQGGAFYRDIHPVPGTLGSSFQIQGKSLSYNNIADADAALECVKTFDGPPACVIVKHANPCGVAEADSLLEAYDRAFATDPTSAFGGIIAFNRELDEETAAAIINRQFVEVIVAPDINTAAHKMLAAKPNVRVLITGVWPSTETPGFDFKRVGGGLLIQNRDNGNVGLHNVEVVSKRSPSPKELQDLLFVWKVAKFVKSNAIVYGKNRQTIGIGAGQMSRVYSAKVAAIKAADENLPVSGSVMASDAFFPFRDGIDAAAQAGISAVIQPGGSVRDEEVIAAANEHDMAMVFTGMRHFRH